MPGPEFIYPGSHDIAEVLARWAQPGPIGPAGWFPLLVEYTDSTTLPRFGALPGAPEAAAEGLRSCRPPTTGVLSRWGDRVDFDLERVSHWLRGRQLWERWLGEADRRHAGYSRGEPSVVLGGPDVEESALLEGQGGPDRAERLATEVFEASIQGLEPSPGSYDRLREVLLVDGWARDVAVAALLAHPTREGADVAELAMNEVGRGGPADALGEWLVFGLGHPSKRARVLEILTQWRVRPRMAEAAAFLIGRRMWSDDHVVSTLWVELRAMIDLEDTPLSRAWTIERYGSVLASVASVGSLTADQVVPRFVASLTAVEDVGPPLIAGRTKPPGPAEYSLALAELVAAACVDGVRLLLELPEAASGSGQAIVREALARRSRLPDEQYRVVLRKVEKSISRLRASQFDVLELERWSRVLVGCGHRGRRDAVRLWCDLVEGGMPLRCHYRTAPTMHVVRRQVEHWAFERDWLGRQGHDELQLRAVALLK